MSDLICEMQESINNSDWKMQLLAVLLGEATVDPEAGPMSLWEAIECLRLSTCCDEIVSNESYSYLNNPKSKHPNWGLTSSNLLDGYMKNLPTLNKGLIGCCERLSLLKAKDSGGFLH
jgi:hypothetical protein